MMSNQQPSQTTVRDRHLISSRFTVAIWAMWAVSLIFVATSLATAWLTRPDDLISAFALGLVALSFATAGAVLVSRLPYNVIGWILAIGGLCFAIENGATGLANLGLSLHPGSVPGAIWFAWLSEWVWAPSFGAIFILVLVYPTGRLLSARWRPIAVAAVLVIALLSFGGAFGPWTNSSFPGQNPLQLGGGPGGPLDALNVLVGPIAFLLGLLVVILTVASLVIRNRRAAALERAQLKWFAAVVALSVPAFVLGTALFGNTGVGGIVSNVATWIAFCGFALLPAAIGIAVPRYRLYEIDRLISRSIAYARGHWSGGPVLQAL
jgi:hypothetical protein